MSNILDETPAPEQQLPSRVIQVKLFYFIICVLLSILNPIYAAILLDKLDPFLLPLLIVAQLVIGNATILIVAVIWVLLIRLLAGFLRLLSLKKLARYYTQHADQLSIGQFFLIVHLLLSIILILYSF